MASTKSVADVKSVFLNMVKAATLAPSPDNNQPWLFEATDQELLIFLDPMRSLPSDVLSMFDMTAIGAAIENAVIAAADAGYSTRVKCFPEKHKSNTSFQAIAEIQLEAGSVPDPLYSAMDVRCTCRKLYSSSPLPIDILRQLASSCESFPDVQIDWLTTHQDKKEFGKLVAATDSLRFRHRPFHEELFRQLRFKKSQVEATKDGLDVRTLELPFGVSTALRCLSSWRLMNVIHQLRMTSLLTIPSSMSVRKSGAIAVFSVSEPTMEEFLRGGRAIERFWLTGASLGLSMHPLGSLPIFLLQRDPRPEFQSTIDKVRRAVPTLLPKIGNRIIQLGMRVGYSSLPSERSRRRSSKDVIVSKC